MKPRALWMMTLLAAFAVAGCVDDQTDDTPTDSAVGTSVTEGGNTLTFGPHSGLPTERGPNWTATLSAPPQWVLGEWWTIEMTDGFVGTTTTVTMVAAGKETDDYLVGMPIDDFSDEMLILHHPGFGLVKSDTLGYEAHDFLFEPLQFPLIEGDTWTSLWHGANNLQTHLVESVDETSGIATFSLSGANPGTYTYDANVGFITEFVADNYNTYRVVDHGFGYEGIVRVPYSHDMTIFHGRMGPVTPVVFSQGAVQSNAGQCAPNNPAINGCFVDIAAPTETFTVPEIGANGVTYDRASFSLLIFELGPLLAGGAHDASDTAFATAGQGVYQISVTAPDGETYDLQKLPNEPGHKLTSHFNDAPAGDWSLTVAAGGPAQVFVEGITYSTFDVDLPKGCVVLDLDTHDHGGECGGHVHGIE